MTDTAPLRAFVREFTRLVDSGASEERIFTEGRALLARLVREDGWLPEEFAQPDAARFRQHLLHCDPLERFSVSATVFAPGQGTPVHDHTVWGMVGVLRGEEKCEEFAVPHGNGPMAPTGEHVLRRGDIDLVSPRIGDIHRVSNPRADMPSVSIHVYGANIGVTPRHRYDERTGEAFGFVNSYVNTVVPNIWSAMPK
ncbi:MAG TPA: cysteine dioxygenase [Telluria sp.]|nr:cysteine dioxygenase [Telluria sp.]